MTKTEFQDLTGRYTAVLKLSLIHILKQPTASLSTSLAGRLAGVVAVQRSGEPGKDNADIWIRGISTMGSSYALVLVEGAQPSFNNIDPEHIESFTVLKDASATAVYGVRGANGVILIKTKPVSYTHLVICS